MQGQLPELRQKMLKEIGQLDRFKIIERNIGQKAAIVNDLIYDFFYKPLA